MRSPVIVSFLLLFLFSPAICFAENKNATHDPDSAGTIWTDTADLIDSMIRYAVSHLGIQYCVGGNGEIGFDCSGFINAVYAPFGIELPRTSGSIATQGVAVPRKQIKAGDIIYFKGRNIKSNRVGHVGLVVQNDGHTITFIHSSVNRGICFDDLTTAYYRKRFLGARRVFSVDSGQ